MGKVGSLGKISFYVRDTKKGPEILSFSGMTRESSVKYEEHPVNGKKALLEYIAPQPDQINMTIVARADFGVSPYKIQNQMREYKDKGTACTFMLGGKRIGAYKWVIVSLSQAYQTVSVNGMVKEMSCSVTLKEYRYKKKKTTTTKSKTKTKKSTSKNERTAIIRPKAKSYDTYTVQKGDTLWGLAKKFYGNGRKYTKIYNANKGTIKNPNKIMVGWKLKIPK